MLPHFRTGGSLENSANTLYADRGRICGARHSARRPSFLGVGGALRPRRISLFRADAPLQAKAGGKRQTGAARRSFRA